MFIIPFAVCINKWYFHGINSMYYYYYYYYYYY